MSRPVDFFIVAPLKEEREALQERLPPWQQLPPSEADPATYYFVELPVTGRAGTGGAYSLLIASPLGMGRSNAGVWAAGAIRKFRPRFILIVGIAGGIEGVVSLGDVLVADQILDYELQKLQEAGLQIRPEVYRADPRLLWGAQNLPAAAWQQAASEKRPDTDSPRCHIGPVASGDKVIADAAALAPYRGLFPKLLGVEMEAGGVANAVYQSVVSPGLLMIRGVSDLADAAKGSQKVEAWRPYAAANAAAFAVALLHSQPVPFAQPTVESVRPGPVNPFADTGRLTNPAQFVGRKQLLAELLESVRRHENRSLIGPARIGRSSILWMLCEQSYKAGIPRERAVYLDLQMATSSADFFEALCTELRIPTCSGLALRRKLEGHHYLICLDEVEQLSSGPLGLEVRQQLRGLADGVDAPLTLVLASRTPLDRLFPDASGQTSPLHNICPAIEVKPFTLEECQELLRLKLERSSWSQEDERLIRIYEKSRGIPGLILAESKSLLGGAAP